MASDLPDHVRRNRDVWNRWAADYVEPGRANWSRAEPRWGVWDVPESAVGELLRANGFEVEALIELRPAEDATSRFPFVRLDWARRWPCEEIWRARRLG